METRQFEIDNKLCETNMKLSLLAEASDGYLKIRNSFCAVFLHDYFNQKSKKNSKQYKRQ